MNTVSALAAAQTTSTSSCEDEKGAQSLKVRACMRLLSAAFDATPCSLAYQRGCPWLPGHSALRAMHACTTSPAVPVLADAIGACRTLRPCGQGGRSAKAAVRERVYILLWMYGTGRASIVPVPCSYGVGLDVLCLCLVA